MVYFLRFSFPRLKEFNIDRWTNKVALVTGASVGIGRSVAEKLAKYGMKVVVCARNEEQMKNLVDACNKKVSGETFPYRCDVSDEEQILSMFRFIKEKFGKLHVCVNNAGLAVSPSIFTFSTEKLKYMFNVNVIAMCVCTRETLKIMKDCGIDDGHIINMNSVIGHRIGGHNTTYCSTKFAVTALTEGLRQELRNAGTHIRSTSISPGYVETEFVYRLYADDPESKPDQAKEFYNSMKCLQAEDVTDAVIYVLSAPPMLMLMN